MGEFLCSFNEGSKDMRGLLGGKGANLSEMTGMGLPVPFGFTVTTKACKAFLEEGNKLSEEITEGIHEKIQEIEEVTGKKFGSGKNPLLVSVRTSSVINIPTMAGTILNIGLNDETVKGLAELNDSLEFALDSYSRFIRMYGSIVRKIPQQNFLSAYERLRRKAISEDSSLDKSRLLSDTVREYKDIILEKSGKPVPQDVWTQLTEAVSSVFGYWNSDDTLNYRELHEIPDDIGVAAVVQSMVFGNMSDNSCIGTVFTRDPSSGENSICGDFMIKAQGGDLIFAEVKAKKIEEMPEFFKDAYNKFLTIATLLEKYNKDMQEIEFTIERNKLYILQTRKGRRSPEAAVRIAVEMVEEGTVDRKASVAGIRADDINKLVLASLKGADSVDEDTVRNFNTILEWADEFRTMGVRANIDTPEDAEAALRLGAEGIGLCRSERMFSSEERLSDFINMILADNVKARVEALEVLKPYQKEDFKKIFAIMGDMPVTVRLLDPSLQRFLPHSEKDVRLLAKTLRIPEKRLAAKVLLLHEENPIIGKRGSRLAVSYPEIVKMQTESIMTAAIEVKRETGNEPNISIMVPFVSSAREFANVRNTVEEAASGCFCALQEEVDYSIGTMIETPRAAIIADKIAEKADFFSFGTNDLTELVYGFSREDTESLIEEYLKKDLLDKNPFYTLDKNGVGSLIAMATSLGRKVKPKLKIGLCGDHGGDAETIEFCGKTEINYVSCSTLRIPGARLAAAQASLRASER